jgi:hypothetical protein
MRAPSTNWREIIGEGEGPRFEQYGEQMVGIQRRTAARSGPGRALHRKQHLGLRAQLEVLPGLPAHARHGLFAAPRTYDALLRLSNGSGQRAPDRRPDVRGLSVRVLGVEGAGALGAPTAAQCFALINSAVFTFRTVDEFMGVVAAAERGPQGVLVHLVKRHGLLAGLQRVRGLMKGLGRTFSGFAREPFHSAAPIACGPYAAKVRLVPVGAAPAPAPDRDDWAADVTARLARGELRWELHLQFFVDESVTPIEDPTVEWPEAEAPFVPVARLVAPTQDPASADGAALAERVEAAVFDPWAALAEHRPLGEIMRARKVVYFASQRERGAA